jgi:hypothetical protein
MSPNGFAEFLGIPKGNEIEKPDQLVEPHIQNISDAGLLEKLWKRSDTLVTSVGKILRHR